MVWNTDIIFLYYPYLNILFKCSTISGVKYLHVKFIENTRKDIKHDNEFIFDTFNNFNDNSIYECLNSNEYYHYMQTRKHLQKFFCDNFKITKNVKHIQVDANNSSFDFEIL